MHATLPHLGNPPFRPLPPLFPPPCLFCVPSLVILQDPPILLRPHSQPGPHLLRRRSGVGPHPALRTLQKPLHCNPPASAITLAPPSDQLVPRCKRTGPGHSNATRSPTSAFRSREGTQPVVLLPSAALPVLHLCRVEFHLVSYRTAALTLVLNTPASSRLPLWHAAALLSFPLHLVIWLRTSQFTCVGRSCRDAALCCASL